MSTTNLVFREVRLDADGTPWTTQRDPALRKRVREVYRKLCESGKAGRQLVATHQELMARFDALIDAQKRRIDEPLRKRSTDRERAGFGDTPDVE